jgi:hypothetical protein
MTPLPPDFWTKPYPGGVFGIIIGAVIGAALGFAFSNYAIRRGWWTDGPSRLASNTNFIVAVFAGVGGPVGPVVGSLIVFHSTH